MVDNWDTNQKNTLKLSMTTVLRNIIVSWVEKYYSK